jgi:hypothetical protein
MADDPRDPLDEHVDRLWERLETTASDEERTKWEHAFQAWRSSELPWWRRIPGLRPRAARLPPREPGFTATPALAPHADWPPGFPREGFFAARDEEVDQTLVEKGPGLDFLGVEAKMVSPVEVATLGEIIGAGTYEQLFGEMSGSEREGSDGACGLCRVPAEIRDGLANADVERVAARWAATEEIQASGWQADNVRDTVAELRSLAGQARSEGKHLWVWWSV